LLAARGAEAAGRRPGAGAAGERSGELGRTEPLRPLPPSPFPAEIVVERVAMLEQAVLARLHDPAAHVGSRPRDPSTRVDVLASRILLHPADLERSLRFYGETLGLAVFREWGAGAHRGVVFFVGAGLLEVSGSSGEPPSGAVRLLLQVRDVQREWRRLAAAGVAIEEEPTGKPWGLIEMVARDPDGLAIVIVEVPPQHPQRRAA
jgi:catechol 2,3-dioxygenase-like lactoylglutathione lyase family enzyme